LDTTAGATANFAVSVCFDVVVPSAAAAADTNITSTEDASINTAAVGSFASSISTGLQEATKTLNFGVFESDNDELLINGISKVMNSRKTFSDEDWSIVIKVYFNQESK
jgi:hypothetical protein